MKRTIKDEYNGKHFSLTAENCNTVELLSFVCDVAEQAMCIGITHRYTGGGTTAQAI